MVSSYTTAGEPDGHLYKACGTRRETTCESCSAVYRSDAWQLIAAGLRGGKGVPEMVSAHPTLFVTLTAPSFGAVHSRRERNGVAHRCHPGSARRCAHGRRVGCDVVHEENDGQVGEPLCAECFDYAGAVLWNAHAGELWRRTTIGIQRRLAQVLGLAGCRFQDVARLSFAKVVEYQRRGVVHLHAVIRVDGPCGPSDPPPSSITLRAPRSGRGERGAAGKCPGADVRSDSQASDMG